MQFIGVIAMVLILIAGQLWLYARYSFRRFEYSCQFNKDEVVEGEEVGLVETLSNRKWLPLPWLHSELSTSRWLEYAGGQSQLSGKMRLVSSFLCLKSYQKISRTWRVKCLKRGEYVIDKVTLVTPDLLGFANFSHTAHVNTRLTVLPRPLEAAELPDELRYHIGDTVVRQRLLQDPFFISGVKEYTGTEPLKQIHWPASVREGKLMVFKNQYTAQKEISVFLNLHQNPLRHIPPDENGDLDNCVRFCAYLFLTAANEDIPFRFLCNCPDSATGRPIISEQLSGEAHAVNEIRALSRLDGEDCLEPVPFLRDNLSPYTSQLIIVSTYLDGDIKNFAAQECARGINVSIVVGGIALKSDIEPGAGYRLFFLSPKGVS